MSIAHFNNFTGGMNNWVHPAMLPENQAVELINATVTNGKIASVRGLQRTLYPSPVALGHYGTRDRSVVKWYERHYWSNNEAVEAPYYGGDQESLGIPYPAAHPTLTAVAPEPPDKGLKGEFKYCWTYVNQNGWESAPIAEDQALWTTITVENQNVKITAPAAFPDGISYLKVYRTQSFGATFYCVGKIETPSGTLVDKVDDATVVMLELASSFNNYPPPDQGKFLTESGGVFFLAVGSRVFFSMPGNPHAWPRLNFVGFEDDITGITYEFQGVLIFTRNNTYRIIGADNLATVTKLPVPGNQGCVNFRSISHVSNSPIWLSNDGICMWNGESLGIVSYQLIKAENLEVSYAFSGNDVYYLFTPNGCLCFDRRNGNIFRGLTYTASYAWYDDASDRMYIQSNDVIYRFGGGQYAKWRYLSPFIGKEDLTLKRFLELRVVSSNGVRVEFRTDESSFTVGVRPGRQRLKLPYSLVGKHAQVLIQGTGEMTEYAVIFE